MADSNETPGTHGLPVQVIFWHPELGMRPEVVADRDGDRADYRAATRIWEVMVRDNGDNWDWRTFLATHPGPSQWRELQDVVHWLEAANMEVPRPQTLYGTPVLRDDTEPGRDRDLTVGVISFSEDVINNTAMFAGFDQADVERHVAERLLAFIPDGLRDLGQGEGFRPDLADPAQVTRWLDRASSELTQVGFSIHQTVLHADPAAADLEAVGLDAPAADTSAATPVEATVWLGAAYLDGHDPQDEPTFVAAATQQEVERSLAVLLHQTLLGVHNDRHVNDFLAEHASPAVWTDPAMVSDFLEAFTYASPGPAFAYHPIPVTITPGDQTLAVAAAVDDNPFDARLMADTDPARLRAQVVDVLADRLDGQPPLQGAAQFIEEHGRPSRDPVGSQYWIDAYIDQIGTPAIAIDQIPLPNGLTATPSSDDPTPEAAPAATATTQRVGMTVRVDDLWAAVIESEELREEDPQVWVGDYDTVAQAAVRILADAINPDHFSGHMAEQRAEFLASHPVDLDNYDSIERWLDAYRQQFSDPAVFLRQVYDPAKTGNLPDLPDGIQPPAVSPEPLRVRLTPEPTLTDLPLSSREEMVVGVIRWGDDPDEVETMVGGTVQQMEHDAAMRMWQTMQSPAFDASDVPDPTNLDAAGITAWLAGIVDPDGKPVLTIHEHVPAARLTQAMGEAINQAVLGVVNPAGAAASVKRPAPVVFSTQAIIDTDRAGDWEVLNDGGIPDLLIAAFPPLPRSEDHLDPDGTQHGDRWGEVSTLT